MTIYPEIDIHNDGRYCQVSTEVRLRGEDGKYYLKRVDASYHYGRHENRERSVLEEVLETFQRNLYIVQVMYRVIPGDKFVRLDSNQESETERLERIYLLK